MASDPSGRPDALGGDESRPACDCMCLRFNFRSLAVCIATCKPVLDQHILTPNNPLPSAGSMSEGGTLRAHNLNCGCSLVHDRRVQPLLHRKQIKFLKIMVLELQRKK